MKAKAKTKAQIDPKLSAALKSAGENGTVEAVLMLRDAKNAPASQQQMDEWKRRIAALAKGEAVETNYFPNLGSLAVKAKGRIVKKLLKHSDLAVATLNRL